MKAEIRPAIPEDVDVIASDIRHADAVEMGALGLTPEQAMRDGMSRSDWTATGLLDGVPVCMFGVAPRNIMLGQGAPWMLAANGLERAQVPFLRTCRHVVDAMRETYPHLANVVHTENTTAIRWLRWLGFAFCKDDHGNVVEADINGHSFHIFKMDR